MTENQLLEIYDLVFSTIHSVGFKTSEIKTLLFDEDYWFLEKPKDNWYQSIINYFKKNDLDTSILKINKRLIQ